jgi:hypothetical protein
MDLASRASLELSDGGRHGTVKPQVEYVLGCLEANAPTWRHQQSDNALVALINAMVLARWACCPHTWREI